MNVSRVFENVITNEFPEMIYNNDIKITISGCMNSCGQHGIATIGFHGSSAKAAGKVSPALEVLLGGGMAGDGVGGTEVKVIKVHRQHGHDGLCLVSTDSETKGNSE